MRTSILAIALLAAAALPAALKAATVEERLAEFGAAARARMAPSFAAARIGYPPSRAVLVGLKAERRVELYAAGPRGELRYVRSYRVLAASGSFGPKLRVGDLQVPEGFYRIVSLNPDSRYHVSLRLDYPNARDRRRAEAEGRSDLGGDIMIHGSNVSIGCLALGDPAAEELFALAADMGAPQLSVILSPIDFRRASGATPVRPWLPDLYGELRAALEQIPLPRS
jgi:murein L,D-transpeptidase YafK